MTSLTILQAFNYTAPLLILPYLTRILDVSEFGAVMVALAVVQVGKMMTGYGFVISATADISKKRDDTEFVNQKIGIIFTAEILLIFLACSLLLSVSFISNYQNYQIIFFSGLGAVIAQAYQPTWLFHGLERMKNYTIYMSATKIFHVILVLLLVSEKGDGHWVLISWSLSNILGTIVALYMLKRLGYFIGFASLKDALCELRTTAQYFWSRMAVVLYTSASSIIVGAGDVSQAALFSTAEQGYMAGKSVTGPVNQAIYPFMAREKNWNMFFKILSIAIIVLIVGSTIVGYYSEFFIVMIFGVDYIKAAPILQVFMLAIVINYVAVCFGYPACSAIERPDIANKTVLFGAFVFAILVSVLFYVNQATAFNVALVILCVEFVVMIVRVGWVLQIKRIS